MKTATAAPTAPVKPSPADGSAEDEDVFNVIIGGVRTVETRIALLFNNDRIAAQNRAEFARRRILALNLVSSPGAGKTALLERTLEEFGREVKCGVIVGDLETDCDARRLSRAHARVAQITTGGCCHLDAGMVSRAASALPLDHLRVLFIENVGNLVCPAAFDLGEALRVVLLSVPEGEDKPLKYPPIFQSADIVLLTKCDLSGPLGFDEEAALRNIHKMAPGARVLAVSARSGRGLAEWYSALRHALGVTAE